LLKLLSNCSINLPLDEIQVDLTHSMTFSNSSSPNFGSHIGILTLGNPEQTQEDFRLLSNLKMDILSTLKA